MKKQILLSALLMASFSATFVSCKKDDNNDTKSRKELIVGTWTVKAAGQDANNNGTLEVSEYDPSFAQLALIGSIKQTFNSNGSGSLDITITGVPGVPTTPVDASPFTWSLQNDDKVLRITDEGSTDAVDTDITKLDNNQLEYREQPGPNSENMIIVLTR